MSLSHPQELAYNGVGFNLYPEDDLAEASLRLREDFFWVSHTWTHMDLTCIDSDCATNGMHLPSFFP